MANKNDQMVEVIVKRAHRYRENGKMHIAKVGERLQMTRKEAMARAENFASNPQEAEDRLTQLAGKKNVNALPPKGKGGSK